MEKRLTSKLHAFLYLNEDLHRQFCRRCPLPSYKKDFRWEGGEETRKEIERDKQLQHFWCSLTLGDMWVTSYDGVTTSDQTCWAHQWQHFSHADCLWVCGRRRNCSLGGSRERRTESGKDIKHACWTSGACHCPTSITVLVFFARRGECCSASVLLAVNTRLRSGQQGLWV